MKLYNLDQKYETLLDTTITVSGWILTIRTQKDITFIKLNDGSNAKGIQLIAPSNLPDLNLLNTGCSITATGTLVKSPAKEQPYEMQVFSLDILGLANTDEYPLSKGKLAMDYLRKYAHLRTRTSSFGSIFRIKSAISHATHLFFKERNFHHINPNIVTVNECEGGAGVFQLTERDISNPHNLPVVKDLSGNLTHSYDWKQDHFDRPAFLTVSSQLQLEALACSLGSVYTTNKSFRSEHSTTNKHLSEFEHLEIEDVFITLNCLMQTGEDYIKFVGNYLLQNAGEDIDNLGKFVSKGLRERLKTIVNATFTRLKYCDAIKILEDAKGLSKPALYGDDLSSEYENYLTDYFKGPVFVSNWPSSIKSFYMKQLNNGECENFDLLMPYKVGELIGGSMREDNLDTIIRIMTERGVSPDPLQFYLDLRRFGSVPHGGFGLGLDRMCMMFTGMENIKDVVAFPVHFKNCNY
jgi:asparaginyl-tRNA synthetase